MTTQSTGLWLIGIGALLVSVSAFFGSGRPRLHLMLEGRGDKRRDRVVFAGTNVGLGSGALGSILVAATNLPQLWFVEVTAAALTLMAYVILIFKLRALWRSTNSASSAPDTSMARTSRRASRNHQ